MTREEFIKAYCQRSQISWKEWQEKFHRIALPCHCDADECQGWQMVNVLEIIQIDMDRNPDWVGYEDEITEHQMEQLEIA